MPLHHVKSYYNLILYYTSTYVERVGVSQHDNACSFVAIKISNFRKDLRLPKITHRKKKTPEATDVIVITIALVLTVLLNTIILQFKLKVYDLFFIKSVRTQTYSGVMTP